MSKFPPPNSKEAMDRLKEDARLMCLIVTDACAVVIAKMLPYVYKGEPADMEIAAKYTKVASDLSDIVAKMTEVSNCGTDTWVWGEEENEAS